MLKKAVNIGVAVVLIVLSMNLSGCGGGGSGGSETPALDNTTYPIQVRKVTFMDNDTSWSGTNSVFERKCGESADVNTVAYDENANIKVSLDLCGTPTTPVKVQVYLTRAEFANGSTISFSPSYVEKPIDDWNSSQGFEFIATTLYTETTEQEITLYYIISFFRCRANCQDAITASYDSNAITVREQPTKHKIKPTKPSSIDIVEETISGGLPPNNPASVCGSESADFETSVLPKDFPDSKVLWNITNGAELVNFVGGNTGRVITVQRTMSWGEATLQVCNAGGSVCDTTTIDVDSVSEKHIRAYIIGNSIEPGPGGTWRERVQPLVDEANLLWIQCCDRFVLDDIEFIINTEWERPDANLRRQIRDYDQSGTAIEVYFVRSFPDQPTAIGLSNTLGVIIEGSATGRAFAHELGHAMGINYEMNGDIFLMNQTLNMMMADLRKSDCDNASGSVTY